MGKKEKKQKKKRSKLPVVFLLLVIAALVVAGILTKGFGLVGDGGDKNSSSGGGADATVSSEPQSSEAEESESAPVIEELKYVNVTVNENEYLYQNNVYKLEELVEKLEKDAADITVKITDNNASKNAVENLTKELDSKNINYIKEK